MVLLKCIKVQVFGLRLNWASIRRPTPAFRTRLIHNFDSAIDFQIQKGSIMKRFIAIAAALAAIVICSEGNAQAQSRLHSGGFPYPGACQGCGGGFGFNNGFRFQREQPPFFAKFPPVYYSRAVKRPYGISPYAAPAGVRPVEIDYFKPVLTNPLVVKNPYYNEGTESAMEAEIKVDSKVKMDEKPEMDTKVKVNVEPKKGKTASWQVNPFFENQIAMN